MSRRIPTQRAPPGRDFSLVEGHHRIARNVRCINFRHATGAKRRPGGYSTNSHLEIGRVEMWRGGRRFRLSVSTPFVRWCPSSVALAPFPHPAHRTGRADFPHPALFQHIKPSRSHGRYASAAGGSIPRFHRGTGRSIGGTPFPACRVCASTRSSDDAPRSDRSGGRFGLPAPG